MSGRGEWIDWAGGDCPVEPGDRVQIIMRRDDRTNAESWWDDQIYGVRAGKLNWRHDHEGCDIIAYRVVQS